MKNLQLIDSQQRIFRINKTEFRYIKLDVFVGNELFPRKRIIKGSTLGWNIGGRFVSYNEIKNKILR